MVGDGNIVLYKMLFYPIVAVLILVVEFYVLATMVFEYFRLDQKHVLQIGFGYADHFSSTFFSRQTNPEIPGVEVNTECPPLFVHASVSDMICGVEGPQADINNVKEIAGQVNENFLPDRVCIQVIAETPM